MKDILRRLASDFLSTILFMAVWLITGDVRIATGLAIVAALAQLVWMKRTGAAINAMQWASLGLVVVLGLATLLTHDSRFVMMKPSIAHFVIGAIMLKPGWMSRYMPPIVLDNAPRLPVIAGDITKFQRCSGWSPEIELDRTLKDMFDWWRSRLKSESAT